MAETYIVWEVTKHYPTLGYKPQPAGTFLSPSEAEEHANDLSVGNREALYIVSSREVGPREYQHLLRRQEQWARGEYTTITQLSEEMYERWLDVDDLEAARKARDRD